MGENHYSILGVDSSANAEQIRKAYIELVRKYHPDAVSGKANAEIFIQIQRAYEVLSDVKTRREYDSKSKLKTNASQPIEVNWILSKTVIPRIAEAQIIYGKLVVKFTGNLKDYKTPASHLCIVLDRSTSMKGERLDSVRQNLRQLISEVRNVDLISVVTFNDKAEIVVAPTSSADKNAIFEKLSHIQAAGGTEMYRGLKAGIDILWQGQDTSYLPNLLLLTDGHTYGDEDRCIELARLASEKNIRISALGFGSDWNDSFLDTVTSITGGCAYYVRNLFDMPRLLLLTLDTMKTTIAHSMNLELSSMDKTKIKFCFKLEPETVQLPVENILQLGSLLKEKQSTFIFAFELPKFEKDQSVWPLINGNIRFLLGDKKDNGLVQEVNVNLPVMDNPGKTSIPLEIVQALSKITLYQMQEKSHADVQNGNVTDAVRRLTYMATSLIGQGNIPFAKEVLNEAENIKTEQSYSEDGIKRLKYGTRALLQLPAPEKRIT